MDRLKIENYVKAKGEATFPIFESLGDEETGALRSRLSRQYRICEDGDTLAMVRWFDAQGAVCEGVNAQDENFRLSNVLRYAGISPAEYVYVNWYRFDDLDKFRLVDLDNLLADIWYPAADDIDLFDDSLSWVLSIAHSGVVKLVLLPTAC